MLVIIDSSEKISDTSTVTNCNLHLEADFALNTIVDSKDLSHIHCPFIIYSSVCKAWTLVACFNVFFLI